LLMSLKKLYETRNFDDFQENGVKHVPSAKYLFTQ